MRETTAYSMLFCFVVATNVLYETSGLCKVMDLIITASQTSTWKRTLVSWTHIWTSLCACVLFATTRHFSGRTFAAQQITPLSLVVCARSIIPCTCNLVALNVTNLSKPLCTVITRFVETFWSSHGIAYFTSARALVHSIWWLCNKVVLTPPSYKLCYSTCALEAAAKMLCFLDFTHPTKL